MVADLDTLLTALYVELTNRIIPFREPGRHGPGRPPDVTDAEPACLAVAQVLLRCDDERHWLRAAPRPVGHLFPRLLAHGRARDPAKPVSARSGRAGLVPEARWRSRPSCAGQRSLPALSQAM